MNTDTAKSKTYTSIHKYTATYLYRVSRHSVFFSITPLLPKIQSNVFNVIIFFYCRIFTKSTASHVLYSHFAIIITGFRRSLYAFVYTGNRRQFRYFKQNSPFKLLLHF